MVTQTQAYGWSVCGQIFGGTSGGGAAASGEVGGEQAEWLAVVGRQRRAVTFEVSWDAAAGWARAVAEGLDTAFSLQLSMSLDPV